ncbi:PKD domain-containing protein [Catenulispora subtropica]|uniref:PKD domain-containing protein n=1 Tax=Catenulispora subtropica TaxID=450798 RepID=A0ABP5EHJ0_9ACTN
MTDQDGLSSQAEPQLYTLGTVIKATAKLTVTPDASNPLLVHADATASTPMPSNGDTSGSYITTVSIDWGDGTDPYVQNSPVAPVPHTYAHAGTYYVTLSVTTGTLQYSTVQQQVTVPTPTAPPPPPLGGPTPPSGTAGAATVTRLGGGDRYETARIASRTQWKDGAAGGVVLARGDAAAVEIFGGAVAVTGPVETAVVKATGGHAA